MAWKQRMIAAYHREEPDHVPVAPELWYLVPAKLTGKPFYEIGSPEGLAETDAYLREHGVPA